MHSDTLMFSLFLDGRRETGDGTTIEIAGATN